MSSSARVRQDDRIGLDTYPSCQEFGVRARARAESAPSQRSAHFWARSSEITERLSIHFSAQCHAILPYHAQHNAIMMRIRRHHLWQVAVRQGRTFRRSHQPHTHTITYEIQDGKLQAPTKWALPCWSVPDLTDGDGRVGVPVSRPFCIGSRVVKKHGFVFGLGRRFGALWSGVVMERG